MSVPSYIKQFIIEEVARQTTGNPCYSPVNPCGCTPSIPVEVRPGDNGLSAYQIAVEEGFIGTEAQWLESLGANQLLPSTNSLKNYTGSKTRALLTNGLDYIYKPTNTLTPDNVMVVEATGKGSGNWVLFGEAVNLKYYTVGDGVTLDTAGLQAAIDYAASVKGYVYDEGDHTYLIHQTITIPTGLEGIVIYGTIKAGASGFLMVDQPTTNRLKSVKININGDNKAVDGLHLYNPLISTFEGIRVADCNGYGLKIERVWDSVFLNISIQNCGNSSKYAFSIEDGGDTSNMSTFVRLQVEESKEKAIYISPNTLSCIFNNIHAERQMVTGSVKDTFYLGGSNVDINNIRVTAINNDDFTDSFANCRFYGAQLRVASLRAEGSVPVVAESWAEGLAQVTINGINCDTFRKAGNGDVVVCWGFINTLTGPTNRLKLQDVIIDDYQVGVTPSGDDFAAIIESCRIKNLSFTDSSSRIKCYLTTIDHATLSAGCALWLNNDSTCYLDSPDANYCRLYLNNSKILGDIETDNGHFEFLSGSVVDGDFTIGPNRSVVFDSSSYVTGTVTNIGPPENSLYAGGFKKGRRIYNPDINTAIDFWICIESGISPNPGTWEQIGLPVT